MGNKCKLLLAVAAVAAAVISCSDEDVTTTPSGWTVTYSIQTPGSGGISDLWFNNPRDGWACANDQILHWDGSRWTVIHCLRNLFPRDAIFFGEVCAPSADNIWAMGLTYRGEEYAYKLYHWDGAAWKSYAGPENYRYAIHEVRYSSSGRIWVGASDGVFIFDDGIWTHSLQTGINAFTFQDDEDAWACGGRYIYHWDGSTWTSTGFYPPPEYETVLKDIRFTAPNLGWVVGYTYQWQDTRLPIFMRYNGTSWETVPWPETVSKLDKCVVGADGAGWVTEFDLGREDSMLWQFDGVNAPGRRYKLETEPHYITGFWLQPNGEAWASTSLSGPRVSRIWHYIPER